jgi:nonribosomal peptide synthetase DhbF
MEILLPLRRRGSRPPLFCIHPLGGLSWCYAGLIRHLPSDYPIYGIQARGLTQPDMRPQSIDQMARDYVDQIRTIQPDGPYHVLGWSFGGLAAHAVATRLQDDGCEVASLSILDAYPYIDEEVPEFPEMQHVLAGLVEDLGYDLGDRPLTFATVAEFFRTEGGALAFVQEDGLKAMIEVFKSNHDLARNFAPRRFRGDVLLFYATLDRSSAAPSPEAWSPYVDGRIRIFPIACRHQLMTAPEPIAEIGAVLVNELAKPIYVEETDP